jgi:hypothetical protein
MSKQSPLRIGEPDFVFDSAKRQIPRRVVLLNGDDVAKVLAAYEGAEAVGSKVHAEVQRQAAEHPGETVALEWLGNLGWTRYLTCKK